MFSFVKQKLRSNSSHKERQTEIDVNFKVEEYRAHTEELYIEDLYKRRPYALEVRRTLNKIRPLK